MSDVSTDTGPFPPRLWECITSFLPQEGFASGRTQACLACVSPAMRLALERRSGGLTIGCHNIRIITSGSENDDDDDDGSLGDSTNRQSLHSSAMRGSIDTSFEMKDGTKPHRNTTSGNAHVTPKKPGATLTSAAHSHKLGAAASSSYANDHCKLRILDAQQHATNSFWPGAAAEHEQPEYEVSISISMMDSCRAEHTRSLWWVRFLVEHYGMFLRHAGFRGRGCSTAYVTEVIQGVHEAQGSLLTLELSDMWFFTVFLSTIATTTQQLVELQHLSLQSCHVFPTMDETVGELVGQLPSLQSITVHQFDFTVGRAKQILEAASEHPCLRHVNLNDNVLRVNAQSIMNSGPPPGMLFGSDAMSRGDSPLLMTQSSTSGGPSFRMSNPNHDHTPDDASRNSSPAPSIQPMQHPSQTDSTSQHPRTVGGGLGVNPYFAPVVASPMQLMPFGSPFSGSVHDTEMGTPYRSTGFGAGGRGGPSCGVHTICATLPHLRVLNLSDNPFGLNGLTQLATPLSRMEALEQLYLGGCGLHGDNTAESLFATLDPICGGLFVIDLSRNDLGDKTVLELCNMNFFAKLSSNVAEVFLAETGLSQVSITTLMRQFSENAEWLTLLDLSVNGWATPQAQQQGRAVFHVDPLQLSSPTAPAKLEQERVDALVSLLGAAMIHDAPVPVAQLRLNFSAFSGDDWVQALRRISRMDAHHRPSPLEVLQLSSLYGGQRYGARTFSEADVSNNNAGIGTTMSLLVHSISDIFGATLTSLDLSRNPLGDEVVTELLVCHCGGGEERRGHCVSCRLCRLQTLHLRKVEFSALTFGGDGSSEGPVTSLVALMELDLSGNRINLAAFSALSHAVLRHLPHLQRLDLSQNVVFTPTEDAVTKCPLDIDGEPLESIMVRRQTPPPSPPPEIVEQDSSESSAEPVPPGGIGKKEKKSTDEKNQDPHLKRLRVRRLFIVGEFFDALLVAVTSCRNSLRRIKLDSNGLSQLHLASNLRDTFPIPASTEAKALLGPLGSSDYAVFEELLGGTRWYSYFLFSINISSS
ncbi:leucine-rich repeat protein, putative [Bodo saltans]|uniref:Leucine-rich repeat protein, putative n=1 Tax=Bodo saltans TaxID=75058 RepID=A0A0S4JEH2_BODSA|nr:leucine-rich repeat protein, putative [Bodo saltans]|eukprot:CUG86769.1 leucine-rich repeat protein, putative [Bodo saltans]